MVLDVLNKISEHGTTGMIEYSEFIAMTMKQHELLTNENLERAFKRLDLDNSGSLSLEEIKKAFDAGGMLRRSNTYWSGVMKSMDENSDNKVSLDEFVAFMKKACEEEDDDDFKEDEEDIVV
jgi:calcium-dependent protein kinase